MSSGSGDERLNELLSVYERAAVKPTPTDLCRDHPDLLERVSQAIGALQAADRAMPTSNRDTQSVGTTGLDVSQRGDPSAAPTPAQIGPYRIIRTIGQGGMGVVYEAEQDRPRRRVALKVIRPGYVNASLLRRFEYEAEVLGRLEHAGIARIYEAGVADTPLGRQPFFAMEFVDGQRLDQFVAAHKLSTKDCLRLLSRVCQAVHHAHTKGVIHRDLKPGNILILPDGSPKVLDFGVARATDSDLQATMGATESDAVIGTLPYMAPEQAAGRTRELDTSSDVYALGVIAYELLAGRMPYVLDGKPLHEAVRVICEEEPSRLSRVDRTLRGDVETIVAKALEKDKSRRYQTAGEFADDVRRYLDYEPITARPASTWYNLKKFARRNRALVVIALALLVGLTGTCIGLFAANHQRAGRLRMIADSYAQAADRDMQRGMWSSAASNFERAIAAGHDDSIAMRIGLIRVLQNQDRTDEARRQIDQLRSDGALKKGSQHRAEALLLEGNEYWISDASRAQRLTEEACEAGLSPAAMHYARGMIARRVPDAIEELKACLKVNPYYHEATRPLAMLLVIMGQFDEGRARTQVWQVILPHDPIAQITLATIAAREGNRDEATRLVTQSQSIVDEKTGALIERWISLISRDLDLDRINDLDAAQEALILGELGRLATDTGFADRGGKMGGGSESALKFPPIPICMRTAITDLHAAIQQSARGAIGDTAMMSRTIDDLAGRFPTGFVLYMQANLRMDTGDWELVRQAARQARDAPSFVRVRRGANALLGLACANLWLSRDHRDPNSSYAPETYEAFKAALREGPFPLGESTLVVRVLMRVHDFRAARDVAESAWMRETQSAVWPLQLAIMNYVDGRYGSAIDYARQAYKLNPNDPVAKTILAKAQKYFDALRDGPPDDFEGIYDPGPQRRNLAPTPSTQGQPYPSSSKSSSVIPK